MQRRAAAAYFAFFLVISVAAYAYIGVAESQRPEVDLAAEATLENESSVTMDGTQYTLGTIEVAGGGGGHGGGGGELTSELTWQNETGANKSVELTEGANVTLGGQDHFVHYPDHHSVQLISSDKWGQYQATLDAQDYFHERKNGLWGVSILSGIAAVMLLGMAYMPTRG